MMYTYIGVKNVHKDFDVFPLSTSLFIKDTTNFSVYINGHKDVETPYEAWFFFKDGYSFNDFVEGMESKQAKKINLISNRVSESTVRRLSQEQKNTGVKVPYLKCIFKEVELYY